MLPQTIDGIIHYEDIVVDVPMTFEPMQVTKEGIIAFARRYDPQIIHLDEEAAKASIVGGLCASGFHTCCMMMRMLCDHWLNHTASLGAPGLDEVKWLKPVRPGDALSLRIVFDQKRVMASRAHVGIARARYEMLNQAGEVVLSSVCQQLVRVRDPAPAEERSSVEKSPKAAPYSLWDIKNAPKPSPDSLYFEDRVIGEMDDLGSHTFETNEIIAFAREWDPQPFHLDVEAGKRSLFGGLAASGWHTAAHFIRLVVAQRQRLEASIRAKGLPVAIYGPSPGFKNLRWIKPVLAGDTLEYRASTSGKVDLKSRPTRGLILTRTQARNQKGEIVFDYEGMILAERRTPFKPA
jgi:acyl dehydratase